MWEVGKVTREETTGRKAMNVGRVKNGESVWEDWKGTRGKSKCGKKRDGGGVEVNEGRRYNDGGEKRIWKK